MSAFDTLTVIPSHVTAGEAVAWSESFSDYPGASYSILYKFAGQTPQDGWQSFSITGTESGTDTYTFTTATTYKPGVYQWERQVTRTSDSVMRVDGTGTLTVMANLATTPTTTTAQTMLTALETAITTLSTTVNASVSFNGQSFTKADMSRLLEQRTRLQAEVYRERQTVAALAGNAQSSFVGIRFAAQ
jgi:hypothetical protein